MKCVGFRMDLFVFIRSRATTLLYGFWKEEYYRFSTKDISMSSPFVPIEYFPYLLQCLLKITSVHLFNNLVQYTAVLNIFARVEIVDLLCFFQLASLPGLQTFNCNFVSSISTNIHFNNLINMDIWIKMSRSFWN